MATRQDGDLDLEPLTPIVLDDVEVGIRPEDRYAAIPPGPKLIRRRVHDESSRAPLWLLAGVVALFAVAALLGRIGSDEPDAGERAASPPVPVVTGEQLLVFGGGGAGLLDVDTGRVRPVGDARFSGPVVMAAPASDGVILFDGSRAHAIAAGLPAVDLGSAIGVAGDDNHAWLLVPTDVGRLMAREATIGGAPAPEIALPGGALRVIATRDGFVTSGRTDSGRSWISYVSLRDPGRVTRLRRDHLLLAASGTTVASMPARCTDAQCDLVLDDLRTGDTTVVPGAVDQGPPTRAVLSPSTEWLFLQYGAELRGIEVDSGRQFPAGRLPPEYPALAG